MNFRSLEDMNKLLLANLHKIPEQIDLIVGVPRSGILPASLLALYLNKPLADINTFLQGSHFGAGDRGRHIKQNGYHSVLVVDDSVCSGRSITEVKEKLHSCLGKYKILYFAVFMHPGSESHVDIHLETVAYPRIFQWNVFHHEYILAKSCLDIDGVLCEDPTDEENDDGIKYQSFLQNARPKFLPTVPIDTLVTCRLEKYRKNTEAWLQAHRIQYKNLVMLNLPNMQERRQWAQYGSFKAKIYLETSNILFIESDPVQAKTIAEISGKSVLCTADFSFLPEMPRVPNIVSRSKVHSITLIHRIYGAFRRRFINSFH